MAIITGTAANNILNGTTGDDQIDGLAGADTMTGGLGNDLYIVDNVGDVVIENPGEGVDTVQSSITFSLAALPNVENVTLTGTAAINATGNAADNVLTGNSGNNTLNGGAGNDTLNGGAGVDTASYAGAASGVVASLVSNTATGGAGSDTLIGIENLTGSSFGDTLTGNSGANALNGGVGADTMAGGAGNDSYVVDNLGDVVSEAASEGTDLVQSSITFSLALLADVENLTLLGAGNTNATGNAGANVLTGNSGANVLNGDAGNDTLNGAGGADVLAGGAGDDVLVFDAADTTVDGGAGTDTLRVDGAGISATLAATTLALERVDLTGTGNNTLSITAAQVTQAGGALRVLGNAGDAVQSSDYWVKQGISSDALGSFAHYTSGAATLDVNTAVTRTALKLDLPLATLDGTNGFRLSGVAAYDSAGRSVSSAGDVNGDGFADLLVGAPAADPNGGNSGASYVVFGKAGGFAADLNLGTLTGANGFRLSGAAAYNVAGTSVSSAGDVNGDGFADLLVGAYLANAGTGAAYVVFGKAAGFAPNLNLAALNGANGFKLSGVAFGDNVGRSVSNAGDVNGDGFDDLLVGAMRADAPGVNSGAAYVVFGKAGGFSSNLNLGTLNGANGFKLSGAAAYDYAGRSVSSAGDLNGDGFADLVVGATNANGSFTGAAYVVFGKGGGFAANVNLGALAGTDGFKISGAAAGDSTGISVSKAGDINGDGFTDLVVGAHGANGSFGAAYVVFGKAGGFTDINLATPLNGSNGFKLSGAAAGDYAGYSVSRAGDVNGDGFDDLLVGATGADPNGNGSGATYVVFGKSGGFAANLGLGTLTAADGFRLSGVAAYDSTGIAASAAGDVNGDGFDDLLVGASGADPNGSYSGAGYVVFGRDFSEKVSFTGATGNDNFAGTAAADIALGGLGNDTLIGGAGVDVLRGGAGNDTLVYDAADRRVDGGTGRDTLQVNGAGVALDLTAIPDTRITGFEQINLTGSGNNSLALGPTDLVNLSDTSNSLRVLGNFGDSVSAGSGWVYRGDIVVGADSFAQYVKSGAVLEVDTDVDRSSIAFSVNLGTAGFKISGAAASDFAGTSVSNAGDVNGDGFDDLLVGASGADPNGSDSGAGYVVLGKSGGFGTNINLGTLNGVNGFKLSGALASDLAGVSVSSAGDVNGDGFDDMLVGASGAVSNAGAAYVVFGHGGAFGADLNLGSLTAATGFRIVGAVAVDRAGSSVASAGDVNGDGFDDLVVGALYADPHGNASGAAYVVFGSAGGFTGDVNLGSVNGTNGFKLSGVAVYDHAGVSVSRAGDVNGDGFDDIVVGADHADPHGYSSGAAYVVFGQSGGFAANLDLSTLDGSNGFKLSGAAAGDYAGTSVSSAGDVNGDGFADLLVGASTADANGLNAGAAYVVFGDSGGFAANIDLSTLNGSNGFKLSGGAASDYAGVSVNSAGDVNGDGFDDLLVGAFAADPNGTTSGAAYVVFGKAGGFAANLNLGTLSASDGFALSGVTAADFAGNAVSKAGDVNGDGYDDLMVGARLADPNGSASGAAYTLFGRDFSGTAVKFDGTAANNTLTGTGAAETFVGGLGNDVILLNGGADSARGGGGDDIIAAIDTSFRRVDGGAGNDTLRLDGSGMFLDLAGMPHGQVTGIENINLNGTGANTLFISAAEVLDLSQSTDTLRVRGGADDIAITPTEGWTPGEVVIVGAVTYQSYDLGQATLLIETTLDRQVA